MNMRFIGDALSYSEVYGRALSPPKPLLNMKGFQTREGTKRGAAPLDLTGRLYIYTRSVLAARLAISRSD